MNAGENRAQMMETTTCEAFEIKFDRILNYVAAFVSVHGALWSNGKLVVPGWTLEFEIKHLKYNLIVIFAKTLSMFKSALKS